ncbi:MAG TPA: hypothetical protein DIS66_06840, partial [Candidatus Omnitrophica bacterium]|nr:hypothetical protein [Candidatus Omnitrophota bacterium]
MTNGKIRIEEARVSFNKVLAQKTTSPPIDLAALAGPTPSFLLNVNSPGVQVATKNLFQVGVINLGGVKEIDQIAVQYSHAAETFLNLKLEVSEDGVVWKTVYDGTELSRTYSGLETFDFEKTKAQYVRLSSSRNTANGYIAVSGIHVYSTAAPAVEGIDFIRSDKTKFIINPNGETFDYFYVNNGFMDRDLSNSSYARMYIGSTTDMKMVGTIDMGEKRLINQIDLARYDSSGHVAGGNLRIEVSADGLAWESVYDSTSGQGDLNFQGTTKVQFDEREVRYIRLFVSADHGNNYAYLNGISAYLTQDRDYSGPGMGAIAIDKVEVPPLSNVVLKSGAPSTWWGWNQVGTSAVNFTDITKHAAVLVYNGVDFGSDAAGRQLELNVQNYSNNAYPPVVGSNYQIKVEIETSLGEWQEIGILTIPASITAQTGRISLPDEIDGRYQNIRLTWLNDQSTG